jgi:hypothetical protein
MASYDGASNIPEVLPHLLRQEAWKEWLQMVVTTPLTSWSSRSRHTGQLGSSVIPRGGAALSSSAAAPALAAPASAAAHSAVVASESPVPAAGSALAVMAPQ